MLPAIIVLLMFAAVVVAATPQDAPHLADLPAFTMLLAVGALSAGLRFGSDDRVSFAFTGLVLLAAIPLVGPLAAVLLGVGAAVLDARQSWWQAVLLNGAMLGSSAAVAAAFYPGAGGLSLAELTPSVTTTRLVWFVGLPLLGADVVLLGVNLLALALVARSDPNGPPVSAVVRGVLSTVPTYLAWAVVAFVVVALWGPGQVGPLALALVVAPLLVTRRIHALFADERRIRAGVIDALASSGGPVDAVDHTTRVAEYVERIVDEIPGGVHDRASLVRSARLHVVGRRCACTFDAPGEGHTPAMLGASVAGAEAADDVVRRIDFLADAADVVRHQAEWFDGSGGPDALAGAAIPLGSRILAVADAFDLATAAGAETSEALAGVTSRAGTRFDPDVVSAARRALGHGGRTGSRGLPGADGGRPAGGLGRRRVHANEEVRR